MGNGRKKNGGGGGEVSPTETSSAKPSEAPAQIKRKADGTFAKGQSGHPQSRFPKGVSGNPGGKPKLIRETYTEWLAEPNRSQPHKTNARVGVEAVGNAFLMGDIPAAREIRTATEGTSLNVNYQHKVVQWLQQGLITVEEVQAELDEDEARMVLLAAGELLPAQPSTETTEAPSVSASIIDGEAEVVE